MERRLPMEDAPVAQCLHHVAFAAEGNGDGLATERLGGRDEAIERSDVGSVQVSLVEFQVVRHQVQIALHGVQVGEILDV